MIGQPTESSCFLVKSNVISPLLPGINCISGHTIATISQNYDVRNTMMLMMTMMVMMSMMIMMSDDDGDDDDGRAGLGCAGWPEW